MKILRALALLGVGWSLVGAGVGCQDRDVSHLSPPLSSMAPDEGLRVAAGCVPGQTIECRGGCGTPSLGYQVCSADGASYGPCVCPPLRILGPLSSTSPQDGGPRIFERSPLGAGLSGGTGGSSGFGSGGRPIAGNSGSGSGVVGAACSSNAECISGLECLTAANGSPVAGGPAGGYCTMPCVSDAACAAVDRASECGGLGGQNMCLRRCASREPGPNESKCLGREDVMCASFASLGLEEPADEQQPGTCRPACQSDAQCGAGRFCNLGSGLCTSVPREGAPVGSVCDAPETCASGLCITLNDDVLGFCSGFCRMGVPGCGYDDGAASVGATCLRPVVGGEGAGDRGICFASCDVADDCLEPGAVCVPAPSDGRAGVCVVPAPLPPPPPGGPRTGRACEQASDCGEPLSCLGSATGFLGQAGGAPGGYCSSACGPGSPCPEGGALCVTLGDVSQCLRACDPTRGGDCGRDTLVCQGFAQGDPTRGACVPECIADAECGDRVCDPASGLCIERPQLECEGDDDCGPGEICQVTLGTCLAIECVDDDDCDDGECDAETNICVSTPECESDAQCGARFCDTEQGLCVDMPPRCIADAECGAQVCDEAQGICVAPPEGCTSDADCGTQRCDLSVGICVDEPSCTLDVDCPGEVCNPSAAVCIAAPAVPAGGACLQDGECAGELCASVDGVTSFCTAFCLLGTPIGCEPYGTDNFCLLPLDPDDDELGICIELCNTAADCAQPGYECLGIGGSINGRTGGCLPPVPSAPPPPAVPPPAVPPPAVPPPAVAP